MRWIAAFLLALLPGTTFACGGPVCLVDPNSLALTRVITFDDVHAGAGPGRYVKDILPLPGATIGERFAGQYVETQGDHDQISGDAFAPLTIMPGADGENFSVVHFSGNSVIIGFGVAGFPKRDAQGEGAIAVLFDQNQSALAFDVRGGEAGRAVVQFYRRDGTLIGQVLVEPTGEFSVGFLRTDGTNDIAGIVVTNSDPQGIAIDTLRFGKPPDVS